MRSSIFSFILILSLVLATPSPASAGVDDHSAVDAAVVASLMSWVAQEMGTKIPTPIQVIASRSDLTSALNRSRTIAIGRPRSGYVPSSDTVIMDNVYWDAEDSTQISLLVHELVHHAQHYMPRAKWACADAREEQAYVLQNKWLEDHGHAPFVSTAWIERVSGCGEAAPRPHNAVADNTDDTPNG